MPSYDYRCPVCGYTEERVLSFQDVLDVGDVCPECSYAVLKRVYHPVAVSFKGGGFYRTDSRTVRKTTKTE
jgi:putative FmdB family regulatory protein